MTEQEAISILKTDSCEEVIKNLCTIMWNIKGYNADVLREALTVAIHAVEKQIPKKPIPEQLEGTAFPTEYKCPVCGKYVSCHSLVHWVDIKMLYCECGQKLEW